MNKNNNEKKRGDKVGAIPGLIFVLVGIFLIYIGVKQTGEGEMQNQNWFKAEAQVTTTTIKEWRGSAGARGSNLSPSFSNVNYKVEVFYKYNVDQKEYNGNYELLSHGEYSGAEEEQVQYPVGKVFVILYNPTNFSESVLPDFTRWNGQGAVYAGIGFILFGMFWSSLFLFSKNKK